MSKERARQLIEAAMWLRLSGDIEGAQRLLQQALKLDPANAKAREYLAAVPAAAAPPLPPTPGVAEPPKRNPFVRPDPPAKAPGALLDADWGKSLPAKGAGGADPLELLAGDVPSAAPPTRNLRQEVESLLRGAQDLLELDDHSGAIDLLSKAQELAPGDDRVRALRQRSEQTLLSMLESKLGDLRRVPRVQLQSDEIIWLNLDHRAGFVLAQIDGTVSYDDLFSLSGMTRLDTARILGQLLEQGVISA